MNNKKKKIANFLYIDLLAINACLLIILLVSATLLFSFFHRKINEETVFVRSEETVQYVLPDEEKTEYENLIKEYEKIINDKEADIYNLEEKIKYYEIKESLNGAEWEFLYRIAVAEAGYSSPKGQANVVCVVLNRVNSDKFPNSIIEVITAPGQFTAYPNLFNKVKVDDDIREAVFQAVYNYDIYNAEGALYFNKDGSTPYLFEDEVGHFFR